MSTPTTTVETVVENKDIVNETTKVAESTPDNKAAPAPQGPKTVVYQPPPTPALHRADFNYTFCYCEENIYKLLEKLTLMQVLDKVKKEKGIASEFDKMYAMFLSSFTMGDRSHEKNNDWSSVVPLRVSSGDRTDLMCHVGGKDCFVTWDYHVIALLRSATNNKQWFVADFDTRHVARPDATCLLLPAEEYFGRTFSFTDVLNMRPIPTRMNPKKLASTFTSVRARLVPSETFLTYFRSDRSHMKDKKGNYESPPPAYSAITTPSPIINKIRAPDAPAPTPYKPQLSNLLVSYLNVSEQKDDSLVPFLGEVVMMPDFGEWLAKQSE